MDIKYQAVGQTIYDIYMGKNIEEYLTTVLADKLQDTSLRIKVISYRQLKQENQLDFLDKIEPLLNMRGRQIKNDGLYLTLFSKMADTIPPRFLDCAPLSEQGLAFIFHNPGWSFPSEELIFKTATDCMNAAARLSAHFFTSDLALSQISTNIYRSFYTSETNSVTAVLLASQELGTDTKLIKKIAATYCLQLISGLQKDLNGKQQTVIRLTKRLA